MTRFLCSVLIGPLLLAFSTLSFGAGVIDLEDLCTGPNQTNCPWKVSSTGALTAGGTLTSTASGTSSLTGGLSVSGVTIANPPAIVSISTTSLITITAPYELLVSTGNALTFGTNGIIPYITGLSTTSVANGTYVVLGSTSSVSTVTLSSGTTYVNGGPLYLGAITRTLTNKDRIGLIYDATLNAWVEEWYQ